MRSLFDSKQACLLWSGLLFVFLSAPAWGQSQRKGDASLRIEYQYIRTGTFNDGDVEFDYWTTDSHVALLSGDYAFSERWSVYAALPYIQKRFNAGEQFGGDPHNPNDPWWIDFVPPDKRFIDDERFHGGLQDLSFGVMYRAVDNPVWTVSPYIGYGFPTNNYPFYAKAAIGANLWNVPVGVDVFAVPYFSDWYFRGNLAYVFSEKPLDINVDYWLGNFGAGYYFTPQFSVNLFLVFKHIRDGLKLDDFTENPNYGIYPDDYDTILWWQHDRILAHRFVNMGIGFDYFFKERYMLSGSFYKSVWSDQTNEVDRAFTLGLSFFWGGD